MSAPGWRWLTPEGSCAIALLRLETLPAALIGDGLPEAGRARLVALRGPDGSAVDEAVLWREDDGWLLSVHGGMGVRAALGSCLAAHGLAEASAPPANDARASAWRALARAGSPAAVAWRLEHGAAAPPFPPHLLEAPAQVLITGPANAGKSTLLNAWCGRARALVSPRAGTTRDLVSAEALCRGWRLRLIDSAGMDDAPDALARAGQALVRHARARADLVLYLAHPEVAPAPEAGDLVVLGLADRRAAPQRDGALWWSALGADGEDPAHGLARLGRAVLARLGLPA